MGVEFGVAVKAMIYHNGKYLTLHKSLEEDINPNTLDLPGGRVEFGETPEEALHREIFEETGLKIKIIRLSNVWSFCKGDKFQLVGITFLCELLEGELSLSNEHKKFAWFDENSPPLDLPDWLTTEFKKANEIKSHFN